MPPKRPLRRFFGEALFVKGCQKARSTPEGSVPRRTQDKQRNPGCRRAEAEGGGCRERRAGRNVQAHGVKGVGAAQIAFVEVFDEQIQAEELAAVGMAGKLKRCSGTVKSAQFPYMGGAV